MGRPHAAWLTSLGLLGVGWVTGHVLSYMLLVPNGHEREQMLVQTGHAYFRPGDLLILCATITLAGLAVCVAGARRSVRSASPRLLALLPLVGFVVQEHVERVAVNGSFPVHLVSEPRFLVGVLLQVPFALAALLCARALLATTSRLARPGRTLFAPPLPLDWLRRPAKPAAPYAPRQACLVLGYSERGPPLLLSG